MSGRGWGDRTDRPDWAKAKVKQNKGWEVPVTTEHHVTYNSVAEYVAAKPSRANWRFDQHSGDFRGRDWLGVNTRAEVDRILERGVWPEGLERMERELHGFDDVDPARSIKRRARWMDQGDELDIHRVYSGQLTTAWRKTQRSSVRSSQNIVIPFPLFITYRDNADRLFWAGAAAIKLADLLTTAGYNVMLVGTTSIKFNGHRTHIKLVVKPFNAPLDISSLVTAIAFPGFSRVAGFRALTAAEHEVDTVQLGGVGFEESGAGREFGVPFENQTHSLFTTVDSASTARWWIQWMLDRIQGVEEEPVEDVEPAPAPSTRYEPKPMTNRERRELDRWMRQQQNDRRAV